ncbi:M48 family metallopeptidase [Solemya velesiana gill symbiont]|nr:M48 family metallopeptidase [Solemya velesiana gill symbiont]
MTQRASVSDEVVAQEEERQREIALKRHVELEQRLATVSYPLLRASSDLCKENWRAGTGAHISSQYAYRGKFRETANRLFGLDEGLQVFFTVEGAPGDRAGLQPGDRVLQIGEHVVEPGEEALKAFKDYYQDEVSAGQLLPVKISRGGELMTLDIATDKVCDYQVLLVESNAVNAYANGEHVGITRGMMRFTETDQELGLVVSHEIAHNAMGHINAKRTNAMGGLFLDLLAAAAGVNTQGLFTDIAGQAYSQEFEAEADYVGLYIMARADHSIEGAANFWRRMAAEHPATIRSTHAASHPASAERFVAIRQTVTEIDSKRLKGLAMMPEMKQDAGNGDAQQGDGFFSLGGE